MGKLIVILNLNIHLTLKGGKMKNVMVLFISLFLFVGVIAQTTVPEHDHQNDQKIVAQTFNSSNPKMTFQEVDSLWKITSFLENEAPTESHFMTYSGGTDKLSGRVRYFVNTDKYEVIMGVAEMPRAMHSQQVSVQLLVNGKLIPIPKKVSYQEYDNPKIINNKIVVRPHVGVDSEGDYFYVIIDDEVLDHWEPAYYFTKRCVEIEGK